MMETIERAAELAPPLRKLVDERLDGIDRALRSAGLPRGERVQVVEDVERQLLDMLAEFPHPPTRHGVLQALSKLDPPEAYLTDDDVIERAAAKADFIREPPIRSRTPVLRKAYSKLAVLSLMLFLGTLLCAGVGAQFAFFNRGYHPPFPLFVFLTVLVALMNLPIGAVALWRLRSGTKAGFGFAIGGVMGSAWLLALGVSVWAAALTQGEIAVTVLVLKDIPFGAVLIWSLRAAIKKRS